MHKFLFKITCYFYSNYIYKIPGNTGFYILKFLNKFKKKAVNNWKCERSRKKWNRIENKVP